MTNPATDLVRNWRQSWHGAALLECMTGLDGAPPDQVRRALEPMLRNPLWLTELVNAAIIAMHADPKCQPPFRVIRSDVMTGMIVADTGYIAIAPLIIDAANLRARQAAAPQTISFAGGHSITIITRSGGAQSTTYQADARTIPAMRAIAHGPVRDGDIFACDDARHSMMIHPGRCDLAMIRVYIRTPKKHAVCEYCAQSGALVAMASNDDAGSRAQIMLTMLRHARHPETIDACALVSTWHSADTRWHAMREWLAMDAATALPRLNQMAQHDPDPAVRDAALATLHMVDTQEMALCPG